MTRRMLLTGAIPATILVFAFIAAMVIFKSAEGSLPSRSSEELAAGQRCLDLNTIVKNNPGDVHLDFLFYPDMATLAKRSPIIIRGTVTEQNGVLRTDLPSRRGPSRGVIQTVQVHEVLKGGLQESEITIGHLVSYNDPPISVGCEAILFIRPVENRPNGYITINGPQGKYVLALDEVSPMNPERYGMAVQYRGMSESQFLVEVREAIAQTGNQ